MISGTVSSQNKVTLTSDEDILSSFDPVIEVGPRFGASSHSSPSADLMESMPDSVQFDLAESLQKIPGKLFFRIGEVAELLDVKTYVLRFWETEFRIVSPSKSKTGQRVYRKKDVELLMLIKHLLYVERFSIEGARKRIRDLKKEGGVSLSQGVNPSQSESSTPIARSSRIRELSEWATRPISDLFRY